MNTPIPLFPTADYWDSRCWANDCRNDPTATQHPRLRGFYCADHTAAILADADRLNAMEGVRT